MKKVILLSSAIILALSLSACSDKKSNSNASADKNIYSYGYECEGDTVVNGYTLPPCPDPIENDSTRLGIDTNKNNVRDDVERWLIVRYKDDHRIVTEIGFQTASAVQTVITDPDKAKETYHIEDAAQFCNFYFQTWAEYNNEPLLINHNIITSTAFKTVQLNTEDRIRAYLAYDRELGGGVYELPGLSKEYRAFCSFDVDKLLGK